MRVGGDFRFLRWCFQVLNRRVNVPRYFSDVVLVFMGLRRQAPSTTTLSSRSKPESCWCSGHCNKCSLIIYNLFCVFCHSLGMRFGFIYVFLCVRVSTIASGLFLAAFCIFFWMHRLLLSECSCLSISHVFLSAPGRAPLGRTSRTFLTPRLKVLICALVMGPTIHGGMTPTQSDHILPNIITMKNSHYVTCLHQIGAMLMSW